MSEAPQHEMIVDIGGGRQQIRKVDYPSNSRVSKEKKKVEQEKAPVEKIVTGPVVQRKRGIGSKIMKTFLVEDSESVIQYVVMDVLVPAAKNTISDVVTQALQQAFWGGKKSAGTGVRGGYTSYNRIGTPAQPSAPRTPLSRQARASHDFKEIILGTREEANDVIESLRNLVDQYEMASVMDLYDLVGLTGDFTDAKWGWTNLQSASVRLMRNGYLLNLPNPEPLI